MGAVVFEADDWLRVSGNGGDGPVLSEDWGLTFVGLHHIIVGSPMVFGQGLAGFIPFLSHQCLQIEDLLRRLGAFVACWG